MESVRTTYETVYPGVAEAYETNIEEAVQVARSLVQVVVFEAAGLTWQSFFDHSGHGSHKPFPGCFRCHNGKFQREDGTPLRVQCTLYDSIPEKAGPSEQPPPFRQLPGSNPSHTRPRAFWPTIAGRPVMPAPNATARSRSGPMTPASARTLPVMGKSGPNWSSTPPGSIPSRWWAHTPRLGAAIVTLGRRCPSIAATAVASPRQTLPAAVRNLSLAGWLVVALPRPRGRGLRPGGPCPSPRPRGR